MKRKSALGLILTVAAMITLAPALVFAHGSLDQENLVASSDFSIGFAPIIAQEFTPQASPLGAVEVKLRNTFPVTESVTLKVWKGAAVVGGAPLATETLTLTPLFNGFVDFDLSLPLPVDVGEKYVIQLDGPTANVFWAFGADSYPDGVAVIGAPLAAFDFVFRTYTFINSPPTDITLDNNTVDENDAGAVIGKLTATDPDPGDTHIFTVDDARFEVDTADNLKLLDGVSLDFETEASVDIDVTATDAGGLGFTKMFTILVNDLADVVVDTTPPTLTVPADITVEGDTNSGALAANATITAFLGAAAANDVVDPSPDITNDAPALFLVGPTTVTFTATDDDGNFATAQATVTVEDTTAPALTVPADITVEGDTQDGALATNAAIATFLAAAAANDVVDPSPDITNDAPALFLVGPTTVTFTATDDDGNFATAQATVTVEDTTAPALTVPADITVEGDTQDGALATNAAIATFLAAAAANDVVDPSPDITNDAPALFLLGPNTVTFTATDDDGNFATAQATVTVEDTTAPALTVPADITVEGDTQDGALATNAAIVAFLAAAAANDVVDPSPDITNDAPGLFLLGPNTVTFTATDDDGNFATAQATVTVEDTTAPALTVPADITVEGDTQDGALATNAAIVAFLAAAAANDVVDPSPDITNDAPGLFLLGLNTVTFTATDDDGNFATAQATVIVVDTTPPALGEPDDITVVIESLAGTVVTYALPTATDIVDPDPAVDCLPAAGSTFGLGPTVVECTATDDSSNSAMTTFTVTVLGPRDLKLEAIELLAPYAGESKEIAKAVKYIEKSLGDRLWDDDLHLDAKRGDKVFTLERKAVKKLSKLLKSRKDGDSDDDESSDDDRRHGRQASDEAKTAAAAAIDLLVDADRILADLIIQEAEAATPLDPKRQKKIDRKIAKANKQLAKGDADLAAGKPDKAIKHYRKAWESANSALKHAQKAPKHRRGRDRDDDDDD